MDKFNNKIIDFKRNNLHLMGYSIPIKKNISKKELFKNLYFLKNQPKAIPYITSYYKKRWGFSVSYNQYKIFNKRYYSDDKFKVIIKSNLNNKGTLNYAELILKGKSKKEIFFPEPERAENTEPDPVIVNLSLPTVLLNIDISELLTFDVPS